MKTQIRTAVLTVAAVLSLGAAAAFASQGGPFHSTGKPSTTPPPWSHQEGQGRAGDAHANGHGNDDSHSNGHGNGRGHN
jgi:hypothetical protein